MMMSTTHYATIQHSLPFEHAPPPGELPFTAADTTVGREDKKTTILQTCL